MALPVFDRVMVPPELTRLLPLASANCTVTVLIAVPLATTGLVALIVVFAFVGLAAPGVNVILASSVMTDPFN